MENNIQKILPTCHIFSFEENHGKKGKACTITYESPEPYRHVPHINSTDTCQNCGHPFSKNASFCSHCGAPKHASHKKNKKKVAMAAAAIIVISSILIFVFNYMNPSLNQDEQLAYQNAVKMQNMLKNPDSFKLYDEMFLIKKYSENGSLICTYTIFQYGGTNSYGAFLTDEAIFKNHQYLMDYADEPDEDSPDYMEQLTAKLDISKYLLYGDSDTLKMVEIDIEKIKNKMRWGT